MLQTGVDDIDHPFHAYLKDEFRHGVEELGTVHEGEMANAVNALDCTLDRLGIPDISLDELEVVLQSGEPPHIAAGIIVEDADSVAHLDQPPD
jgi:hypothetical protein